MEFHEKLTIVIHQSRFSHEAIADAAFINKWMLKEYRAGRKHMPVNSFMRLIRAFVLLGEPQLAQELIEFVVGGDWNVEFSHTDPRQPSELFLDSMQKLGKLVETWKEAISDGVVTNWEQIELSKKAKDLIRVLNEFVKFIEQS